MSLYILETGEPLERRFETGLADGLVVYATRELAEKEAAELNENFPHENARVVEVTVKE